MPHYHLVCACTHPRREWTSETTFNACPLCRVQLVGTLCTEDCMVQPFRLTDVNVVAAMPMPIVVVRCDAPVAPMDVQPVAPPRVDPALTFTPGVVLLDHGYRARYADPAPPPPTATMVSLRLRQTGEGTYDGTGTLSVIEGSARLYTNAGATIQHTDPFNVDNPATISNADLRRGLDLWVLGEARGRLTLRLGLSAQAPFVIGAADTKTATVVMLEFDASSFAPEDRVLTERRKLVNGKLVPVAGAGYVPLRSKLRVKQSAPAGPGTLLLHIADGAANRLYVRPNDDLADTAEDRLGADLVNENVDLWLQGRTAHADWFYLGLGMTVDGTVLRYGDCLRVKAVAQNRVSLGFEWEVPRTTVDRRHDGNPRGAAALAGALQNEEDWEGVPSKAAIFRTGVGTRGMKVVTEVTPGADPSTYGEFVLGPAYTYADLEEQLGELRRFYRALEHHGTLVTYTPETIYSREPGEYNVVWLDADRPLVIVKNGADWRGTAQPSFAVPIWWVPITLAALDVQGVQAKRRAEIAAEGDARIDDVVLGLIAAIEYYIEIFLDCPQIQDGDGPKVRTPLMFRTDFHSMYRLLTTDAQRQGFAAWAGARPRRGDRVLPNRYKINDEERHDRGPRLGEWLDSIIAPAGGPDTKDLMSPPPGIPRYHTQERIHYSMGFLSTDATTSHVIFEYRGGSRTTNYKSFLNMVFEWAEEMLFAGDRTWEKNDEDTWASTVAEAVLPAARPYTVHGNNP